MNKLRNFNWNMAMTILAIVVVTSCAKEDAKPTLVSAENWTSPVINNAATGDAVTLLPEKANDIYETFRWQRTGYNGVQLSTDYVLQIDTSAKFTHPKQVVSTSADSSAVTVTQINSTVLAFGATASSAKTYHLRLRSMINSYAKDTLYSTNTVTRLIKPYILTQCGNYCSMGIIGDATPGGWDVDTDMHLADPSRTDKYTWTITVYLTQANVKFRASDAWTNNWGASSFPSGTGTLNGANIPISAAGWYSITFNDQTAAYTFTHLTGTAYTPVSLIGDATPGGWDADTDMTQTGANTHIWTSTVTLAVGAVKFRANHDWTVNWGGPTSPSGYGVINGANISVTVGGTYFVWFNDVSGEYHIGPSSMSGSHAGTGLSLIGPGASDWNTDVPLITNPNNGYLFSKTVTMVQGDTKFRTTGDWTINWGGSSFPSGTGQLNGANIPAQAGTYFVTINSLTGEYNFLN